MFSLKSNERIYKCNEIYQAYRMCKSLPFSSQSNCEKYQQQLDICLSYKPYSKMSK